MAKNMRVVLDRKGVKELLKSAEMQEACQAQADAVISRAGNGYASDAHRTKERVIINVWPDTFLARQDNAGNNTLLKALRGNGGGR